jgi:hypothetical protein
MPSAESRCDVIGVDVDFYKSFVIVPVGDIHFNAPMFARDAWNQWRAKWRTRIKAGENVWFLGMGDYLETLSGSERKAMQAVHESTQEWMDDHITKDVAALAKDLDFTKDRWLGWITGNHEYVTGDGYTTSELLARALGGTALGVEAWVRLHLRHTKGTTLEANYDIYAHHGVGGGVLAGSTLNAIEKAAQWANVDLVLMGHHHAIATSIIERVSITGTGDGLRLKARPVRLCRTGSFLKSHEPGRNSYATRRALRPATLGSPEVGVRLYVESEKCVDGKYRNNYHLLTEVTM